MSISVDPEQLLESIIEEHGGDQLSVTEVAICRSLAACLTSDAPSAKAIEVLTSLLPPKRGAGEAYDLTKLTDEQLDHLDRLTRIMNGETPPEPQPTHARQNGHFFIGGLSALEERGVSPVWQITPEPVRPTPEEVIAIKNALDPLLWHCGIRGADLYAAEDREGGSGARLIWLELGDVVVRASERAAFIPAEREKPVSELPEGNAASVGNGAAPAAYNVTTDVSRQCS